MDLAAPLRRLRPAQYRWLTLAVGEAGVAALAVAASLAAPVDQGPHPERVEAIVQSCDVSLTGAAQVSYLVHNGDGQTHSYRVQIRVRSGAAATVVGDGVSLVTDVGPDATVTARALVPVSGAGPGATCALQALVWEGHSGHHGH